MRTFQRLIVISNRLPVTLSSEDGELKVKPGSGGLVSALEPLLRTSGGYWIGNPGVDESPGVIEVLDRESQDQPYGYVPVHLSQQEKEGFYEGFSNSVIWPLFHDLQSRCDFDPAYWRHYQLVNEKFAEIAVATGSPSDVIWVQDYQLMLVGKAVRKQKPSARLAFFLHTPFPGPDIFGKLPWRAQILDGLLEYDLVGFQTERDLRNFLACLRAFLDKVQIVREEETPVVYYEGHKTHSGAFPISIDFEAYSRDASKPLVQAKVAELKRQSAAMKVLLGVDRLDYTKGIPERIRAFNAYLRQNRDSLGKVILCLVVVPSREAIPEYQRMQEEIERMVASVNGEWGNPGWTPIVYMRRPVSHEELLAFYRVADVALVTPLKDGMNLVAKEYCAAKHDAEGVLILSEFAGAAAEFDGMALLVNPYDEEGVAETIKRALTMADAERRNRMRKLRRQIQRFDLIHWRDSMLSAMQRIPPAELSANAAAAD